MRYVFVFVALCIAGSVSAHGDGASFETTVEGYFIDVGYSTPTPTAEDVVLFDFGIEKEEVTVPFDDVWVRIEQEGAVVFAGAVHNATFGGARLSYRFPGEGAYTIYVRFETTEGSIAEATFPMAVTGASGLEVPAIAAGVGLILGAAFAVAFMRRTRA